MVHRRLLNGRYLEHILGGTWGTGVENIQTTADFKIQYL